jgi:2-phosphoglycolate phosphatase
MPLAVVFDLDGTLVDSAQDIAQAANFALRHHGLEELPAARLFSFIGDGARKLMSRASGQPESSAGLDALLSTFVAYYTEHSADNTVLMKGALQALQELAAYPLALCTNKPRGATETLLEKLGLVAWLPVIVAGGDLPVHKPHPAPLLQIAQRLSLKPAALVMVGDGPQDVECGKAAGCRTVGVRGGILSEELLLRAQPDALIDDLTALPAVIERWRVEGLNP